jgi:hypothetical protein
MATFQSTVAIARPGNEVFAFLADLGIIPAWKLRSRAAVMNGRDPGLASSGGMRRAAPGAGAALALVHGLYTGDRDRATLRDEVLRQRLR